MIVQEYLKDHTLDELSTEFGIDLNIYPDRVVLNYNQISSYVNRFHPLVKECRALILSLPDHKILSRSFDRFFNFNEDNQGENFYNEVGLNSFVFSKEDGSLINVYHDGVNWCASTRKMAFGEGKTISERYTFLELFLQSIGEENLDDAFYKCDKDCTYIFELTSRHNRVVKVYDETRSFILCIRNKYTGEEFFKPEDLNIPVLNVKRPEVYEFKSLEGILTAAKNLPTLDEGYVCAAERKDRSVWRIKIKNPAYLAVAHLRGNGILSTKRIALLVMMQDYEEYLSMFPEDIVHFQPYIDAYDKMMEDIQITWEKYKDEGDQRKFAAAIQSCLGKSILFKMKKDGTSVFSYIDSLLDNRKIKLLEMYKQEI